MSQFWRLAVRTFFAIFPTSTRFAGLINFSRVPPACDLAVATNPMSYQRGQNVECPACHRDTIVHVKILFDGWTAKGEHYVCGLCAADLGPLPAKGAVQDPGATESSGLSKAATFLGTTIEAKPRLAGADDVRPFCRDCRHFIKHPFECRCHLWDRRVEPMMDCPKFELPVAADKKLPNTDTP